jgi:catechol 2,3-dioxygenase-like lactoylglutathione lyase family enzyme
MDFRRPTHVTLAVADLRRALAFWHEALGIPVKLRGDASAELQSEGVLLTLVERERVGSGSTVIGFEVDDLAAARTALQAAGIALTEDDAPPAGTLGRRLAFTDPDGHRLEVRSYR